MREIKFRAWDKEKKEMIMDLLENLFVGCKEAIDNPRFIVMQYTGLKDKNGKETYEGDIVREGKSSVSYEVVFRKGCFGILTYTNAEWSFLALDKIMDLNPEVIGNIYENPELIKEKG